MVTNVVIVGSGFGGLAAAIRLRRAGVEDVVILERASDVGGTWRANRYPGCRCDVSSNLYSLSFAPNPNWSNTYSYQPEIWAYLRHVAEEFQLYDLIRFDHDVTAVTFDEGARTWRLDTNHGPLEARVVILATGGLAEPRPPDIAGVGSFRGEVVHTANWDEHVEVRGKRVGVIGTGASAVQVVPQLAPQASHLDVFQRTPPWILPHLGHPVKERTKKLFRRVTFAQRLVRYVSYWRRELLVLGFVKNPSRMNVAERQSREFLQAVVPDAALREKLTPHYRLGCKRVLISNDYYPALLRENVSLVTSAITRITERGVQTSDGAHHDLDLLVYATGFYVTDNPMARVVHGTHGAVLADAFAGDAANFKGTTFPQFPNLFMLGGPNTGLGHSSIVFMIESQLNYVVPAVRTALRRHVTIEPTVAAATAWTAQVQRKLSSTVWAAGCQSWYLNAHGVNTTIWPDFTFAFRRATRHFDERDHLIQS